MPGVDPSSYKDGGKTNRSPRYFVAIFPERGCVNRMKREFRHLYPGLTNVRLRRVPADRWHVTLKYLGILPPEHVDLLATRLAAIVGDHRPFRLCFHAIDWFPDMIRARVLAAMPEPSSALARLACAVAAAASDSGLKTHDKPFNPHMTLARPRQRDLDPTGYTMDPGPCTAVPGFGLYESRSGPGGLAYLPVRLFLLEGPALSG